MLTTEKKMLRAQNTKSYARDWTVQNHYTFQPPRKHIPCLHSMI